MRPRRRCRRAPAPAHGRRLAGPVVLGLARWRPRRSLALGGGPALRAPGAAAAAARCGSSSPAPTAPEVASNYPWPAAISPDGGTLVYAVPSEAAQMLYSRRMDQLEGHPIPGTPAATQPLFSPDGQWLAFEAGGKERKVRLDGSAPVTIAEGGGNNGADWTTADELVAGRPDTRTGSRTSSVAGGELAQFTQPDSAKGELDHLWPIALPDGRTSCSPSGPAPWRRPGWRWRRWTTAPSPRWASRASARWRVLDGTLVYVQADGAVMAVPLDVPARLAGRPCRCSTRCP